MIHFRSKGVYFQGGLAYTKEELERGGACNE